MINTLASMALAAGHDILAPEQRFRDAPSEEKLYKNWNGLYYPEATSTGIHVTEANALSYVPVLACTRVISETWASMPLKVFRRTAAGVEEATDHYLYSLLHDEPNPEMSSFSFIEAAGVSLCLYNAFYAEIEWNNAGRVKALWPLMPDRVTMRRVAGRVVYDYATDSGPVTLDNADVLHIPGCLNLSGLATQSLVSWAREAIGLGLAPERYAANFYKNNARPGIYLQVQGALSDKQRMELAAQWNAVHAGIQGAGRTGVTEGGAEIKTVGTSQKDAEFSETRYHQLMYACAIWRVPPHMIANLRHATFSNIEHQDLAFAKHSMTPYCRRTEQTLNRKLIGLRTGYYAEFVMDGLMRGDLPSRTEANARAIQTGQLKPNEARRRENRGPAEGGDKLYIQGATVPLDMAGKQPAQTTKQGAGNED